MKAKTNVRRGTQSTVSLRTYPAAVRAKLAALRRLILETAKVTEGVGTVEETLKWVRPAL